MKLVLNITEVTRDDSGRERDRNDRYGGHSGKIWETCQTGRTVDQA